jgi:hypothetical protein
MEAGADMAAEVGMAAAADTFPCSESTRHQRMGGSRPGLNLH